MKQFAFYTLILVLSSISAYSQATRDTIFFNAKWTACSRDSASFFRPPPALAGGLFRVRDYFISGMLQMDGSESSLEPESREGYFFYYNSSGDLEASEKYHHNRLLDTVSNYFHGRLVRRAIYSDDSNFYSVNFYDSVSGVSRQHEETTRSNDSTCRRVFTPSGKLKWVNTSIKDKRQGCGLVYDTVFGNVSREMVFLGDKAVHRDILSPGGKLKLSISLDGDRWHGLVRSFDTTTGALTGIKTFFNDSATGPAYYYSSECAQVKTSGTMINNHWDGFVRYYHKCSDKLYSIVHYKNRILCGPFIAFDKGTGQRIVEGLDSNDVEEGEWKFYFPDGKKLRAVKHYRNGKLDGELMTWWPNGYTRRREQYEAGSRVSSRCFASSGGDTTYYPFFVTATFLKPPQYFFDKWMEYTDTGTTGHLPGSMKIRLKIEADKTISKVKILSSTNKLLDTEAERVAYLLPVTESGSEDGVPFYSTSTIQIQLTPPE